MLSVPPIRPRCVLNISPQEQTVHLDWPINESFVCIWYKKTYWLCSFDWPKPPDVVDFDVFMIVFPFPIKFILRARGTDFTPARITLVMYVVIPNNQCTTLLKILNYRCGMLGTIRMSGVDTRVFCGVWVVQSFLFCLVFCRSLFLLYVSAILLSIGDFRSTP